MKQGLSVLLMMLSLLVGFQQTLIVMHFKLNQKLIEQKFCVNKDRPELHCDGRCFLKKQLQNSGSPDSATATMYPKVDMLPISIDGFEAKSPIAYIGRTVSYYVETSYREPCLEIFVPPPIV